MPETPAQIIYRIAKLSGSERLLFITPGPNGAAILSQLAEAFSSHPQMALEASSERLRNSKCARRVLGQATRLPFKMHAFEAVISFEALFAIRPPWTVLAEFHRVLVPDGKLILCEPLSLGIFSSLRDKISGPGKRVFPLNEIKSRLARADYAVEEIAEFNAISGLSRPAYCVRALKRENPVEPVPQFLTAKEMMERRKKIVPKGEELP